MACYRFGRRAIKLILPFGLNRANATDSRAGAHLIVKASSRQLNLALARAIRSKLIEDARAQITIEPSSASSISAALLQMKARSRFARRRDRIDPSNGPWSNVSYMIARRYLTPNCESIAKTQDG
jgi:hypothetical protein